MNSGTNDSSALAAREGSYDKAQLILDALQTLQAAHRIDERDDLNAATYQEWYDRVIPTVRDHKILAGAMEIELARRRGERIEDAGELRGRKPKVSQCLTFNPAAKQQRSEDRALAAEPAAVDAYLQHEATAGRVPSKRGAVRAARAARKAGAPHRVTKKAAAEQARQQSNERIVTAILKIADGKRRTDAQVATITGYSTGQYFLDHIRLIPWMRIDRSPDGVVLHIDETLRAICDGRQPRPTLSYQSIEHFLRDLRTEITRRRKENHDDFLKRRWNSELILKREQSALLDWIETQLDRVPPH